ncbi:uncharacterized protein JN550_007480 [Neoarthrinium moseri]|uniref:uncharacterized protein n=1 Tax=Neoarthrinium moseri TaxID=1658444 RepID=UPI001FDD0F75|nr:uncharacterized protein JN550_007480 [Neoarthrinium moseri]KAI1866627.1 hypothetical protein JN550_007480 [Neoarthrinium moseri]
MAAIKPITGMLKKGLITDLSIALGTHFLVPSDDLSSATALGRIGAVMGSLFWHGYHMPRTIARDNFYSALEKERATKQGQ